MKILCIATKSPWPPLDGGRLALWLTLEGLAVAGHELLVIAPVADAAQRQQAQLGLAKIGHAVLPISTPRSWWQAGLRALRRGQALTNSRHQHAAVEQAVATAVCEFQPEVVHVEQLQALTHCGPARAAGIGVLLRMQNVESALWSQVGRARRMGWPLRLEARRLRADEQRGLCAAKQILTLTERDAQQLRTSAPWLPQAHLAALPPPFPAQLPAGPQVDGHWLVLAGSGGWWPNQQACRWFLTEVWPLLHRKLPALSLRVYGGPQPAPQPGLHWSPAPDDAIDAFPAGAIAAVPLFIGSGIRMRILEAWARGLPVIASACAAAGLAVKPGRELLFAETAEQWLQAVQVLLGEPQRQQELRAAGRAYLVAHHDPQQHTQALVRHYLQTRERVAKPI